MTVSFKTTLESFKDALTSNAALAAWCHGVYGRAPRVYVNIDLRDPPGEADCPYLLLTPVAARYGRAATQKMMEFDMLCCTHDEEFVLDPETNAVQYLGVQRSMDLLDYAVAALAAVSTGNALLQEITAEFETIEYFPFFMVGCPIALVEPLTLTADRVTL